MPLRHKFFKCNYLAVKEHSNNVDWDSCLDSNDVRACVSKFNDVVSLAIPSHVPLSSSSQCSFPHWYMPELKSLINDEKCAHSFWKSSHNYSVLYEFKVLRAKCISLYKDYFENTKQSLKRNIKYFWRFAKGTRNETSLPSSMFLSDEKASNGCRISHLFARWFSYVYLPS